MNTLKSIMVLSSSLDQIEQPLQAVSARGINVEAIEGTYRLVAAFAERPADAVVLDLADFRRRDIEVLQVLREVQANVGIVALADPDQRDLAADALCAGADLYLMKPVFGPELVAAIDRAGLRRQLAETKAPEETGGAAVVHALALGVAHEINNPLTTISGWLQVLISDHAADEKLVGVLRSMKEETDRVAEIVRQLLLFAQQAPPKREPVNIGRLLTEVTDLYAPQCTAKGIQLGVNIPDGLPPVAGDDGQLRQACDAILAEAQAVLTSANRIDVTCERKNNGVEIVFHDDGPPIARKDLARIFEPFQPGRRRDGKAMGLSLPHGIIRSHGGKIEADSSESLGTRFTVWLPLRG